VAHPLLISGTDTAIGKTTVTAAIAAALRDLGWMVVEYTTVDTPDPAHSQDAAA